MANQQERELRRLVASGLAQVNQRNGGRFLSAVARRVNVDRTTVTRWSKATCTPSADHCRSLARYFPDDFDDATLLELHALAALGGAPGSGPSAIPGDDPSDIALLTNPTIGADVHWDCWALHRAMTTALTSESVEPQNRSCTMTAFHLDRRGLDVVTEDDDLDVETRQEILAWRAALMDRAAQGWKIRVVTSTANPARLETIRGMVQGLDGPNVEIHSYGQSTPMTIAALVIANRHVVLGYDHRRWERPDAAIVLRSRPIVDWANQYIDQVFHDAPFRLRTVEGPDWAEFDRLQQLVSPGSHGR